MFDVVKGSDDWDYYVVDTLSENGPVAAFLDKGKAETYCTDLNNYRKISCCKASQASGGWHHCSDCKGYYEKPVMFNKIRKYYHNNKGNCTEFEQVAHNQWSCINGGWTGTVISDDQLTMKHACGEVTYTTYEEETV